MSFDHVHRPSYFSSGFLLYQAQFVLAAYSWIRGLPLHILRYMAFHWSVVNVPEATFFKKLPLSVPAANSCS